MFETQIRVVGKELVQAKLAASGPRILEQNRALVTSMLELVKETAVQQTPTGPGHFGYHLRDRYGIRVVSIGVTTKGELTAPPQGYWREFGTRGRFATTARMSGYIRSLGGQRGERAFMTAHKALGAAKRFISFYYGGMANWWRS